MSRRPRPAGDDRPCDRAVADPASGAGLADAVAGAGTIVHCATNLRDDTAATRRLLAAARAGGRTWSPSTCSPG